MKSLCGPNCLWKYKKEEEVMWTQTLLSSNAATLRYNLIFQTLNFSATAWGWPLPVLTVHKSKFHKDMDDGGLMSLE